MGVTYAQVVSTEDILKPKGGIRTFILRSPGMGTAPGVCAHKKVSNGY